MKTHTSLTLAALLITNNLISADTYTVAKGDNLYRISKRYHTRVQDLIHINALKSSLIRIGQRLKIPEIPPVHQVYQQSAIPATSHTIARGDTLSDLSLRYRVSVQKIRKTNAIKGNVIRVGQVLIIPAASAVHQPELLQKPIILNPVKPPTRTLPAKPNGKNKSATPRPEGIEALSKPEQGMARLQILLDRKGMGPGVIDGRDGRFSRKSVQLATQYRPMALKQNVPLFIQTTIPKAVFHYINQSLPGTGRRPDYKAATQSQCLLMYATPIEMLAERYHCSETLLHRINPRVDFSALISSNNPKPIPKLWVPNVRESKIETFMKPNGKAASESYLRKTQHATLVEIHYPTRRMFIWRKKKLLATFPITVNTAKGPRSSRKIEWYATAPPYQRKKTGLNLQPGSNSPVGIVWASLGSGFGIHGTADGAGNGYNTSAGCIRLSNWDMAIFIMLVPPNTPIVFVQQKTTIAQKYD